MYKERKVLLFTFILPVIIVGMMAALSPGKERLVYVIPGNLCMLMMFTLGMGTTSRLIQKKVDKTLTRIFLAPIKKRVFIGVTIVCEIIQGAIMTGIMIILLLLWGIELMGYAPQIAIVIFLFIVFASSFGIILSAVARSFHAGILGSMCVILPLCATSGAWIPITIVESQLGGLVNVNPMYHSLKVMDNILLHGESLVSNMFHLGILMIGAIFLLMIGLILFNKLVVA